MNTRILNIIKFPELLKASDIGELKREISNYPYVQPIRALYLMAIHQFQPRDYEKELSLTAAYTTDKKILFQLVNPVLVANSSEEDAQEEGNIIMDKKIEISKIHHNSKEIYDSNVGETINLEELEENFPTVIQSELINISEEDNPEISQSKIIKRQEYTESIAEKELSSQEVFLGEENFLSRTKLDISGNHIKNKLEKKCSTIIKSKSNYSFFSTFTQPIISYYTLAEDKIEKKDIDCLSNSDFYFLERSTKVQNLENYNKRFILLNELMNEEIESVDGALIQEIPEESKAETKEKCIIKENEEWKPMSFNCHIPEDFIRKQRKIQEELFKTSEIESQENNIGVGEIPLREEGRAMIKEEKKRVGNIFGDKKEEEDNQFCSGTLRKDQNKKMIEDPIGVQSVKELNEKMEDEIEESIQNENLVTNAISNVSSFINTWQSWLRKEKPENFEEERKKKVIEKFIENNPRISSLKSEVDYVVKDKGDDISHLMTETLANLYLGQRLYTKAISAFEILQRKYPEKKKELQRKINYIRDLKSGKIQSED